MPDKRTHRGPHPQDAKLFAPSALEALRSAVADFSLLLTKGYAEKSALKLVGDRFGLTSRQRMAVVRSACSDQQLSSRRQRLIGPEDLAGRVLAIDGYNILITIEAALSGGIVFKGRDGCFRDIASIHGTYRKVSETIPAVELVGEFLQSLGAEGAEWLLDSPVSNSGRLKTLIRKLAGQHQWRWDVKLLPNPDVELAKTELPVASSDGVVLDRCGRWVNLSRAVIESCVPEARVVDLS